MIAGAGQQLGARGDEEAAVAAVAGLADEVKVVRVPVRMLEPEAPLAEIDFSRDPGFEGALPVVAYGGQMKAAICLIKNGP